MSLQPILRIFDSENREVPPEKRPKEIAEAISWTSVVCIKRKDGRYSTGCLPVRKEDLVHYGASNGHKSDIYFLHVETIEGAAIAEVLERLKQSGGTFFSLEGEMPEGAKMTELTRLYEVIPLEEVAEVTQWPHKECRNLAFIHLKEELRDDRKAESSERGAGQQGFG